MEYTKYPTANLSVLQNYHPTHPKSIIPPSKKPVNIKIKLAPLHFCPFLFAKKQACGPEGRVLRGKSIGGKRNPAGDPIGFPQKEAGPPGARPGAPTTE
jgi:hypothetical protein